MIPEGAVAAHAMHFLARSVDGIRSTSDYEAIMKKFAAAMLNRWPMANIQVEITVDRGYRGELTKNTRVTKEWTLHKVGKAAAD